MAGRVVRQALASRFVEVKVGSGPGRVEGLGAKAFEVVLVSGVVIRVPEGFDAVSLDELLDVLGNHRC
jgi:hypothetical protein